MIFRVDFEKAFDSVRWDYLDDILKSFDFGDTWRSWIFGCLNSAKGSVLINGSPTSEFQFHKGLKQGDPLSPFLFISVMESLHRSFSRVMEAGLFKGEWNIYNIKTIVNVLNCLFMASGLKINLHKSKLSGIGVSKVETDLAASMDAPLFLLLFITSGLKLERLCLESFRGRKSLTKSLLDSHVAVLKDLESIRRDFFHGADKVDRKMVWVHWEKVLASKNSGGLGVSSLYATNRALLFKWIWRFLTQCSSLWSSLIKAIHGVKRNIDDSQTKISGSIWQELVREFVALKSKVVGELVVGDLAGELVVEELIVGEIIVGELMLGELMSRLLFLFGILASWAKEVSRWIPEFEDDDDEDSQSDVEMSKNGSIDEDGGTFKFPNVKDESDCEEVSETIFEKNQSSANMKEDYVGVQKDTSSEDPFNIYEVLNKKKDTKKW
ncbi:RNA-directed DNA polymerase, eukaryota [Tanacetum coccineum]